MKTYVVGKSSDYYSQRNNQYDPMNTCNVTSMIQAADLKGYKFAEIKDKKGELIKQPEDRLYYICNHYDIIKDYYKVYCDNNKLNWYNEWIKNPSDKNVYRPNEVHSVLCYATNYYLNLNNNNVSVKFNEHTLIDTIISDLINGNPVVMSGCFNGLNHVVTATGVVMDNDVVKEIIINDPYGKTYEYKLYPKGGYNVHIPYTKFISDFKSLGNTKNKLAHRFG